MFGFDGFEIISFMCEVLGDCWVFIIYFISYNSDDKVLVGIEVGGDDYLVKFVSYNFFKVKLMLM